MGALARRSRTTFAELWDPPLAHITVSVSPGALHFFGCSYAARKSLAGGVTLLTVVSTA